MAPKKPFQYVIIAAGLLVTPGMAQAQTAQSAVRAGRDIAVTQCFVCHAIARDEAKPPVIISAAPGFVDLANRPGMSTDHLVARMKTARWHDDAMAGHLLPMSNMSDDAQRQVASYIMSLRENR